MQSLVSWVFLMKFLFHDKSIFSLSIKTEELFCHLCLSNAEQDDQSNQQNEQDTELDKCCKMFIWN